MAKRPERGLTSAFCRSAKPIEEVGPEGRRLQRASYPDLDVKGLELRVSPNGEKSWSFRYTDRLTGRRSRITLGLFDPSFDSAPADGEVRTLSLSGARVAARALRAQVDAGVDPAAERRLARETARAQPIKTLRDLAERYFEACEQGTHRSGRRRRKSDRTISMERWMWNKYLASKIGDEFLERLTRADLKAVLATILAKAPSQADKCRALLSQFFNYAIEEERLEANPVARIPKMSEVTPRTRTLAAAELRTLWKGLVNPAGLKIQTKSGEAPLLVSEQVRLAIQLALVTLQRRSEIAGMQTSELDLENKIWVLPAERTKGREEHLVPLSDLAIDLIKKALALNAKSKRGAGTAVFAARGAKDVSVEGAALSHAMADITHALKLHDATLHDLRRTGATGMAALGIPPYVISKVLAHKDNGGGAAITARHYNLYAYAAEKREALDRWSARVAEIMAAPAEGSKAAA